MALKLFEITNNMKLIRTLNRFENMVIFVTWHQLRMDNLQMDLYTLHDFKTLQNTCCLEIVFLHVPDLLSVQQFYL